MLERLPTIKASTLVDYSTHLTLMVTRVVNLQSSFIIICNYILRAVKQFKQRMMLFCKRPTTQTGELNNAPASSK
jgi:hypothetical protein